MKVGIHCQGQASDVSQTRVPNQYSLPTYAHLDPFLNDTHLESLRSALTVKLWVICDEARESGLNSAL